MSIRLPALRLIPLAALLVASQLSPHHGQCASRSQSGRFSNAMHGSPSRDIPTRKCCTIAGLASSLSGFPALDTERQYAVLPGGKVAQQLDMGPHSARSNGPPAIVAPAPPVVAPTTFYGQNGGYYGAPILAYEPELPPRPPLAVPYCRNEPYPLKAALRLPSVRAPRFQRVGGGGGGGEGRGGLRPVSSSCQASGASKR